MNGTNVIKSWTIIITKINRNTYGIIELILTLPTPLATNRVLPTGGVTKPITIFETTINPKCTASKPEPIPRVWAMGRRTGTTINNPGATSMNILITKRATFNKRSMNLI